MKVFVFILVILSLTSVAAAQNKTIILVRHAEKDVSATASKTDPDLTEAGRRRAEKLFDLVKSYKPEQIFSTPLKRTFETALPTADRLISNYRLQIQFYDFGELDDFAAKILKLKAKTVLIVGHHLLNEDLANLIIGEKKYQPFGDNEYGKAIFIRIKGKQIEDRVIEY
jgi:phosphohistidine phosphatase SixA